MATQYLTKEVAWLNPRTGLHETMTELARIDDGASSPQPPQANPRDTSARAHENMQRALAFRSGKAPEHKLKQMETTVARRRDSPALASMRKALAQVSQADGGTGPSGASSPARSNMRATLDRMGVPAIGKNG